MKISTLFLAIGIIFLGSCTKEDDIAKTGNTSEEITLTYPVNLQDLNPCCIDFQWNNPEAGSSRIMVSKNQNFTDLVLDSTLVSNNLTLNKGLLPNTEYFWKVSNSKSESESSFKIKDVLSELQPTYPNAKIRYRAWGMGTTPMDTTYYDTIKLTKENNDLRFEYSRFSINQLTKVYKLAPNTVTYRSEMYAQITGCEITINYLTDAINIYYYMSGSGGGSSWSISLKK